MKEMGTLRPVKTAPVGAPRGRAMGTTMPGPLWIMPQQVAIVPISFFVPIPPSGIGSGVAGV